VGEPTVREQIDALDGGRAVLDLAGWTTIRVRGADARGWLNDLVTASVEDLEPGIAVRSLLLGPTGRIRADFHVAAWADGFLLVQGPGQPEPVDALLTPYVLSSDVELGPAEAAGLAVMPLPGPRWRVALDGLSDAPVRVGAEAFEAWRVRHGIAAFPNDVDQDSLPSEAGLDEEPVIDRSKGCYLGQESVARVRNLGHPPRVVQAVDAGAGIPTRTPVFSTGSEVGIVTSAEAGGRAAIVRIRWDARDSELATEDGTALERR
jgi:tRNA-modifying protein YgfZ